MKKIGKTLTGNIIVELTPHEWQNININDGRIIITTDYNIYSLLDLWSDIFGGEAPAHHTSQDDTFTAIMTNILSSLQPLELKILEVFYELTKNEGLPETQKAKLLKTDEILELELGTAKRIRNRVIRKLRHPHRSRILRQFRSSN